MAIPEHFLFDSDYPADKIGFLIEDTITTTKDWEVERAFYNTHINTLLYPEGDYTVDDDDNVYPLAWGAAAGGFFLVTAASFMLDGECWIAVITLTDSAASIGKKVHFRLWAYFSETDGKNAEIGPTANVSKPKLIFTSDEEYPKFIGDGKIPKGQSYIHGLGYTPIVKAWQYNNQTFPNPKGGGNVTAEVYQVILEPFFGPTEKDAMYAQRIFRVTNNGIFTFTGGDDYIGTYYRMYLP